MNETEKCLECNCCWHCDKEGCECGCKSCGHSTWDEATVDME